MELQRAGLQWHEIPNSQISMIYKEGEALNQVCRDRIKECKHAEVLLLIVKDRQK